MLPQWIILPHRPDGFFWRTYFFKPHPALAVGQLRWETGGRCGEVWTPVLSWHIPLDKFIRQIVFLTTVRMALMKHIHSQAIRDRRWNLVVWLPIYKKRFGRTGNPWRAQPQICVNGRAKQDLACSPGMLTREFLGQKWGGPWQICPRIDTCPVEAVLPNCKPVVGSRRNIRWRRHWASVYPSL